MLPYIMMVMLRIKRMRVVCQGHMQKAVKYSSILSYMFKPSR